jgi:hypothetical protein
MSLPLKNPSSPDGWPERREKNIVGDGKLLSFGSEGTEWEERICVFLTSHPKSSLLAVVQYLRPDFLALPPERRAQMWFWVKEQLRSLDDQGVLQREDSGEGLALWSFRRVRHQLPPDELTDQAVQ